jgi:small-conductance mechanosensitive channel
MLCYWRRSCTPRCNVILWLPVNMMSSTFIHWPEIQLTDVLRLAVIFIAALIFNRLLRVMTNLLIKPAAAQTRAAQSREQQTRTLATVLYAAGSKVIWVVAGLTALAEIRINILPAAALAGLASLALGFGAQNLVRDIISGFYIVLEDQFVVGDTIQIGETVGRVEHVTLRRTVVRDPRGALVTISNGEIRSVANMGRDWSQAFVDVTVSEGVSLEKTLQVFETAAAELRGDAAWAPALVDGPRVLGVHNYDRNGSTIRMQVRTAPTRQDEVARELRRRIQSQFQAQGIAISGVQRVELVSDGGAEPEISAPSPSARTV